MMAPVHTVHLLGFIGLFLFRIAVSDLVFEGTPSELSPGLTKHLQLHCSLASHDVFSGVGGPTIIGRRQSREVVQQSVERPPAGGLPSSSGISEDETEGRIDTRSEDESGLSQLSHVTSIVISKLDPSQQQNVTLASVTLFGPPVSSVNASLNGQIGKSSTGGDVAFLDLDWDFPSQNETGVYYCEVFALTNQGKPISRLKLMNISCLSNPVPNTQVCGDIRKTVSDNQDTISKLLLRFEDYERRLENLTTELNIDKIALEDLNKNISTYENQVAAYQKKVEDLQKTTSPAVSAPPLVPAVHVEEGTVSCPSGGSSHTVRFSQPYKDIPHIHVGLQGLHLKIAVNGGAFYVSNLEIKDKDVGVSVLNKSPQGFIVNCALQSHDTAHISWISVGL